MDIYSHKSLLAFGAALALGAGSASAQQTQLFAVGKAPVTGAPTTFTINRTTGADTPVGPLGDAATLPFGLAVSGGVLYTFDGNTDQLRQINPFTGSYTGTPISLGVNLTGEGDIAFGVGGVGYITTAGVGQTTATPALYTFTLGGGTTTATLVGPTTDALGPITVDGLAFNPANSVFYAITAEDDRLYTLNTSSGLLTPIGTGLGVKPGNSFGALTFDNGTLFGVINDGLFTINTTTGVATAAGNGLGTDFGSVSGLAAAVPEPSAAAMLAVGGALLLRRRRK